MTLNRSTCRLCGLVIWWTKGTDGKPLQLDGAYQKRFVLDGTTFIARETTVYTKHTDTCPEAKKE